MIGRIKVDAYAPQLRQLSELLAETIRAAYGPDQRPDIMIPVPLHWSRQLRRGFNQSQGIAQILSSKLGGSSIHNHCLRRSGYRRPQHLQGKRQRLRSMNNAFEVRTPKPLEGRTVRSSGRCGHHRRNRQFGGKITAGCRSMRCGYLVYSKNRLAY